MIPREQIDEILDKTDIVEVISEYVDLKRRGSSFLGRCPFHSEKTPSFSVSREKNIFHCFGCHEHGNVIGFLMKYENLSYVEAVKFLAERAGVVLTEEKDDRHNFRQRLKEINRHAGIYYYKKLRSEEGKEAYKYLKDRGLKDETINQFGLGYAPKSIDSLYKYIRSLGYTDEELSRCGLFSYYNQKFNDKFYERIMFPILDKNGKVIAFGGRALNKDAKAKYLNSPETEIFYKKNTIYALNIARKARSKFMILCEGYMDVISMHQAGFAMAMASMGTAFNESHALELKKYTKNIFMLFDSDEAGQNATVRAAKILVDNSLSVKIVDISPYKDPDECLKSEGVEFIIDRLKSAVPEIYFRIDKLKKDYDLYDPQSKLEFIKEVAGILSAYSAEYIGVAYKDIAKKYLINEDEFYKIIMSKSTGHKIEENKLKERIDIDYKKKISENKLDKTILWFLLREDIYPKIRNLVENRYFADKKYIEILEKIDEAYKSNGGLEEYKFLAHFDDEKKIEQVAEIFHINDESLKLSEFDYKKHLNQTLQIFISEYYDEQIENAQDIVDMSRLVKEKANKLEEIDVRII